MLILALLSLLIWLGLLGFWGQFWRCDRRLSEEAIALAKYPSVCAIVPARNEADLLPKTLRSLLLQDYPGGFSVILIDDRSTDDTAKIAREIARESNKSDRLDVIVAEPLPVGWSGKLWAMENGIRYAKNTEKVADFILFTDADIEHHSSNLSQLVAKAETERLDLVSLMVLLRCESFWEILLIPAFVFFFQKLYPFAWVNQSDRKMAAAAGGCILIRQEALNRIGGLTSIRNALIDDCTLAAAVKSSGENTRIWLGLTEKTCSLRPYLSLTSLWDMVARTAYTQLHYSPLLLLGTMLGMSLIYLVPPIATIGGSIIGNWTIAIAGAISWLLMAVGYFPTLKLYQKSFFLAFSLPFIAFLYTLMTVDSALRHWQGKGGSWKGRIYERS